MTNTKKPCIHCDLEISSKASTCPHCQKIQSHITQGFLFLASITSVLSAAGAIILLAAQYSSDVYVQITRGDNIIPMDFRTNGKALFYNNGYRPLRLRSVEVSVDDLKYEQSYDLNLLIPKGEMVSADLGELKREPGYAFNTEVDKNVVLDTNDSRLYPGAIVRSDSNYIYVQKQYKDKDWKTFSCKGTINAVSPGDIVQVKIPFDCAGIIYRDKDQLSAGDYLKMNLPESGASNEK